MNKILTIVFSLLILAAPALATDYNAVNETIWPTQNDIAQTAGDGKKLLENQWQNALNAVLDNGANNSNFVVSGLTVPATSANLNLDVAAGDAILAGRKLHIPASTTVTFTNTATNYIFLKLTRDGSNLVTGVAFEVNTTGTAPTDSIPIAQGVASGGTITSTLDRRRFGPSTPYRLAPWFVDAGVTQEGSVTINANQNLSGVHFYTDFTLNSGKTITVPAQKRRLIIIASNSITINGTINAQGAGGPGGAPQGAGYPGTDQAGGGGGWALNACGTGGSGGSVLAHGITIVDGGAGGNCGSGSSATAIGGSDLPFSLMPFNVFGGAGGGGSYDNGGGPGGGSIVLIAPAVTLGATAILNSKGSNGGIAAGSEGSGGGGAGNIYIAAHAYTNSGATFQLTGGVGGSGLNSAGGSGEAGVLQVYRY